MSVINTAEFGAVYDHHVDGMAVMGHFALIMDGDPREPSPDPDEALAVQTDADILHERLRGRQAVATTIEVHDVA